MKWLKKALGIGDTLTPLATGTKAPDFSLPTLAGETIALSESLESGPVLLVFFKISCPVCQFALPFIERIHKAYAAKSLRVFGVSQNPSEDTRSFAAKYGLTFPIALDETSGFPVSNAYGLTHVPTFFWVAPDRTIEIANVSWSKVEVEELNRRAAESAHTPGVPLFRPDEKIADFRAG